MVMMPDEPDPRTTARAIVIRMHWEAIVIED